jgi:hypothetical protein
MDRFNYVIGCIDITGSDTASSRRGNGDLNTQFLKRWFSKYIFVFQREGESADLLAYPSTGRAGNLSETFTLPDEASPRCWRIR